MRQNLQENINRIKSLMNIQEGEVQLPSNEKNIVDKFVDYVKKELQIKNEITVRLQNDKEGIKTTAVYNYEEGEGRDIKNSTIRVYTQGRALVDILRSIAHEFVHHQQNEKGKLQNATKGAGTPVENEANSKAGDLIRNFGEKNPEIYGNQKEKTEVKEEEEAPSGGESSSPPPSSGGGASSGGETKSSSPMTKWESGVARGKGNQIANTVWSTGIGRGPANQVDNTKWSSDAKRGKANPLW